MLCKLKFGKRMLRHSLYNYKFRNSILVLNYSFGFFVQLSSFELIVPFLSSLRLLFNFHNFIICSKFFFFFLKRNYLNIDSYNFRGIIIFIGFENLIDYLNGREKFLKKSLLSDDMLKIFNKSSFLADWFLYSLYLTLDILNTSYLLFVYFIFIYKLFFISNLCLYYRICSAYSLSIISKVS